MTRTQAIAIIEKALPAADEATLAAVAELLQNASTGTDELPRELTPRELELIEQSKEDFRHGRTLSSDEYRADMSAFLEVLKAKHAKTA